MKTVLIKISSLVLIFSFLLVAFVPLARAQTTNCEQATSAKDAIDAINKCAITNQVFDDKIFNLNQIAGTSDSLLTLLTGYSQLHPQTDQVTANSGAIASAGHAVAALYGIPPASGVQYFAQQIQRFNPVQPAYAQEGGIGFSALTPVQRVWSAFRNISYIGFVLIFIVIGFMVMFRAKISPQAVATVQDSLPRIVVALILVTFSYAIVGLMIDAMFVFLNVIINFLKSPGIGLLNDNADKVLTSNVFFVIWTSWGEIVKEVFVAIEKLIEGIFKGDFLGKIIGVFGGSIAGVIMGIALLFIMFRVFFMLLMAYVTIIILTIFAPFLLLFQALPGNNGAKEWFKQLTANILVFPVVALMFLLAGILSGIQDLGGTGEKLYSSGEVGQFPLFTGGLEIANIGALIGLGILLMTPTAAKIVKDKFGIKEGGGIGAGAGVAAATLGAGAGAIGRPFGAAINPVKQSLSYQYGHGMAERIGRFTGKTDKTPSPTEEEIATGQRH